jgi:L-fucose mutarotase
MLKGINPILSPELLATLRSMGHGDEIALVDGNYPGQEHGRRLVRMDGHGLIAVLDAILSVMPIDDVVEQAMFRATVGDDINRLRPIHERMIETCAKHEPRQTLVPLLGPEFYPRVKAAHTIVQTSEPELNGNIILRKGVIYP